MTITACQSLSSSAIRVRMPRASPQPLLLTRSALVSDPGQTANNARITLYRGSVSAFFTTPLTRTSSCWPFKTTDGVGVTGGNGEVVGDEEVGGEDGIGGRTGTTGSVAAFLFRKR